MKLIDGTSIYETERGAKNAAGRQGIEGARVFDTREGFALMGEHEGFAGSPAGARLCFSAKLVAIKRAAWQGGKWESAIDEQREDFERNYPARAACANW